VGRCMLRLHGLLPLLLKQYSKSLLLFRWGLHGTGNISCMSPSVYVHISHMDWSFTLLSCQRNGRRCGSA
jgi:hypothetical protein